MRVQEGLAKKKPMTRNAELLENVRQLMRVMLVSERTQPEHQHVMRFNALDFHLLGLLRESGTLRSSEAADQLGVAPTTTSSVIARLKSRGLIAREQSKMDKRAYDISLTGEGAGIAAAIHQQDLKNMGLFLSALEEDEQESLISLLSKVVARVRQLEEEKT